MKMLFIVPPNTGISKDVAAFTSPNSGLAYLCSYLRERGVETKVLDCEILGMGLHSLRKEIGHINPDVIGITANTIQIKDAAAAADMIKRSTNEEIPVIIGGPHVSAMPERTMEEFRSFDCGVVGEGEDSTLELIGMLEKRKCAFSEIDGIVYRDRDGKAVVTGKRNAIKNLDALPFPAFDLFPLERYRTFYSKKRQLPLSTGRGKCPNRCVFCARNENVLRFRSIRNCIEEIRRNMEVFGINRFFITDESFTASGKRVELLCDAITEENLQKIVSWSCQSRVDAVDLPLLGKMKAAGCDTILYGIESGNQKILDRSKKGITVQESESAIRNAKKSGIVSVANFILGLPWETEKTIKETIRFALKTDPDFAIFATLVPFPGTEVAAMAERGEGGLRYVSRDWDDYGREAGNSLELSGIRRKMLERLQTEAYLRFYLRPSKLGSLARLIDRDIILPFALHKAKALLNKPPQE